MHTTTPHHVKCTPCTTKHKPKHERKNNNDCRHRNHRTRRSTQRHLQRLGRPRAGKPLHPQPAIPHPRRTQRIQPQHPRLLKHKPTTTPETTTPRGFTRTPIQGWPPPLNAETPGRPRRLGCVRVWPAGRVMCVRFLRRKF
nr:MAG TPA: hypothetical protein [Caudoviricetes sp.]